MSTTANRYMMSKVTGLDPPGATISTATYATMNGSQLNRAFLEKRNIVISFEMRGIGVEKRRHRLYRVAKPSEYIKVYYRTSNIDVYTEGVVETCEPSRFDMPVSGQISILCPDVYFYSTQDTIVQHGSIVSGFKFPFAIAEKPGVPLGVYRNDNSITIQNNGDTIGMEITLEAKGGIVGTPTIYNADTGAYLRITGDILEGDKITCSDGYVYEITDVSKYQNSMFATQETDTLPDPTCDWSLLDQPTLPEPEANHFTSGGKEYMFVRNLFETRRMQYTLYNAIGDNPQTWQNGKPVTRADGSPLVTVKLSIPESVAANSFWPWRSDQIVELFN